MCQTTLLMDWTDSRTPLRVFDMKLPVLGPSYMEFHYSPIRRMLKLDLWHEWDNNTSIVLVIIFIAYNMYIDLCKWVRKWRIHSKKHLPVPNIAISLATIAISNNYLFVHNLQVAMLWILILLCLICTVECWL